jgi:hypothetical protein
LHYWEVRLIFFRQQFSVNFCHPCWNLFHTTEFWQVTLSGRGKKHVGMEVAGQKRVAIHCMKELTVKEHNLLVTRFLC